MIIRPETDKDIEPIRRLTERAFEPMPYSHGTEPAIIEALRQQGQLTLSLVAEDDGKVVGQITFSPVTIDGDHDGWFGLGPVSVLPEEQGQYIGSQLVNAGLKALKQNGAKGCVLVGSPDY
jgi:putative acetyltransferase